MDIQSCYENLANAIILQAVEDYRESLQCLLYEPDNYEASVEKKKIERFFRSDEFSAMTRVDGRMLIRKLKMEVKK